MSQTTIHDVAQRAGVSKSLVSLVMQNSPSVSDEKRQAVQRAARELGYRPNVVARSLRSRRTHVLGVMVSSLSSPFHSEIVEGIESAAQERDYRAVFNTGRGKAGAEAASIDALVQMRTDGLILSGAVLAEADVVGAAATTPVVLVARPTRSRALDSVTNDDDSGTRLAIEHLLDLGHRRIAHIWGGPEPGGRERRRAYEATMRQHGLAGELSVERGGFTEPGGAAGMRKLLENGRRPTAVFAPNDLAAVGAMRVIEEAGLRIPEDISLVGYDNTWLAALEHISLTSVDQPRHGMGRRAVELLVERLDDGRSEARHEVMMPSLVVRNTTAAPP